MQNILQNILQILLQIALKNTALRLLSISLSDWRMRMKSACLDI